MFFSIANRMDYVVMFVVAIIVIIGIYQFYFWCQRNNQRPPVTLHSFVDNWFELRPRWIWVYSGLYYPIIIVMVFTFKSIRHFNYTILSFVLLLLMQMLFFVFLPVQTPDVWRVRRSGSSLTDRFMNYVQAVDGANNCFPSMHMSVATLTALHLLANIPAIGFWIWIFPALIGVSAMYTKQHYFLDLLPGAGLGWVSYRLFMLIYRAA